MKNVIIVHPSLKAANHIKKVLVSDRIPVQYICSTGSEAFSATNYLDGGVVICNSRLPDMPAYNLISGLPPSFDVVVLLGSGETDMGVYGCSAISLRMPLDKLEFIGTVRMLTQTESYSPTIQSRRRTIRSAADAALLKRAKDILMRDRGFTEAEAHRYLQKQSMDTGKKIMDLAHRIVEAEPEGEDF